MKNLRSIIALLCLSTLFSSCILEEDMEPEEDCNGKGYVVLTNYSNSRLHRVYINNVSYGTLDPGESKEYSLTEGTYTMQQEGIGGGGCSSFYVNVTECSRQGFSCSN